MLEVRVLLGGAQPGAALRLVLVVALVRVRGVGGALAPLQLVLFYALGFALLLGGGFGVGLGLGFGGLFGLFALDFGVFGCVPGVEDLFNINDYRQLSMLAR